MVVGRKNHLSTSAVIFIPFRFPLNWSWMGRLFTELSKIEFVFCCPIFNDWKMNTPKLHWGSFASVWFFVSYFWIAVKCFMRCFFFHSLHIRMCVVLLIYFVSLPSIQFRTNADGKTFYWITSTAYLLTSEYIKDAKSWFVNSVCVRFLYFGRKYILICIAVGYDACRKFIQLAFSWPYTPHTLIINCLFTCGSDFHVPCLYL